MNIHDKIKQWEQLDYSETKDKELCVMNIKWDYGYYQPWSDNEWLVDKMLAMLDKNITMQ